MKKLISILSFFNTGVIVSSFFFVALPMKSLALPKFDTSLPVLDEESKKEIASLAQKPLKAQLEIIAKEFNLELLSTNRPAPKTYFDSLGPATRSVDQITDIEGLYGKAVCPSASDPGKPKILIAKDAPPLTLIHEYIHARQIKKEKRWCELDNRILETEEKTERALLYHRFEFEVFKTIWEVRSNLDLTTEDRLILIEGLNRENKTFASIGVKALDEKTSALLEKEFEEVQLQISFFTWMSKSHSEAASVLQKMEILTLKACVEKTDGSDVVRKINTCVAKRCEFAGHACQKTTEKELKRYDDDLLSEVIHAWVKPFDSEECPVSRLKNELMTAPESPTSCWKIWYEKNAKNKDVTLKKTDERSIISKYRLPSLSIDKKIDFYETTNPESFINAVYCFFIFQKVIKFESLPVDQFPYATLGASFARSSLKKYRHWLSSDPKGRMCSKVVKVFTNDEPETWEEKESSDENDQEIETRPRSYVLIINPLGALTGGLQDLRPNATLDINHERLHAYFADNKALHKKVRKEWQSKTIDEQEAFKKSHSSYDFSDETTLLKEYFSFSHQSNPRKIYQ